MLIAIAREEGQYGPHLALFEAIGRVAPEMLGSSLPLNGAGVCGAILADLGFPTAAAARRGAAGPVRRPARPHRRGDPPADRRRHLPRGRVARRLPRSAGLTCRPGSCSGSVRCAISPLNSTSSVHTALLVVAGRRELDRQAPCAGRTRRSRQRDLRWRTPARAGRRSPKQPGPRPKIAASRRAARHRRWLGDRHREGDRADHRPADRRGADHLRRLRDDTGVGSDRRGREAHRHRPSGARHGSSSTTPI